MTIVAADGLLPGHGQHDPRADPGGAGRARADVARTPPANRQILRKLRIPNALPYWFTALAHRDDAERHRRGRRGVLRRAAVLARDLHHARRPAPAGTRRHGRRSCSRAPSGSCCTSSAVALERLVDAVARGSRNGPMRTAPRGLPSRAREATRSAPPASRAGRRSEEEGSTWDCLGRCWPWPMAAVLLWSRPAARRRRRAAHRSPC